MKLLSPKWLYLSSFLRICLSVIVFILNMTNGVAQTRTLIYSDHEPLDNMRTHLLNDVLFPAIERESNGRLKIEPHWNGEIAISYDALQAVTEDGKADMTTVVPEYVPNKLPIHLVFKSFPTGPSGQKQIDFFHKIYDKIPDMTQEISNAGIKMLMFCIGQPTAFFSSKPLEHLNEIKGGKWRTASFWHQDFMISTGVEPVRIPWGSEVNKALRENKIDGVMVNIDSGTDINIEKDAPYIMTSKSLWMGHLYLISMNKNTWNSLSQDDKSAIERAASKTYDVMNKKMNKAFNDIKHSLKQHNAKVKMISNKELDEWSKATNYKELQKSWGSQQEQNGIKNTNKIINIISEIKDKIINHN